RQFRGRRRPETSRYPASKHQRFGQPVRPAEGVIRLGEAAPVAGNNVLAGKLVESTFLGNIVDHQVDVSGSLMRVQGDRQQTFEPGANVNLIVPITECVAMQGDTSQ
ncbi:MAG: TOBE domain-containing protein, partial [Hyphomicrobium sp.]|nr:TOBE domain-containing protein [Hyphomicrobium sp.]